MEVNRIYHMGRMSKILDVAKNAEKEKTQQQEELKNIMKKQQIKLFDLSEGCEHTCEEEINHWIQKENIIVESFQITSHSCGQYNESQYVIVVLYHTSEE